MGCIAESILSVRRMKQPFQNTDKPSALLRFVVRVFRGASWAQVLPSIMTNPKKTGKIQSEKLVAPQLHLLVKSWRRRWNLIDQLKMEGQFQVLIPKTRRFASVYPQ